MDDPYTSPDSSTYSFGEASWNPALRPHVETPATAKGAFLIDDILAASGWDSIGASTSQDDHGSLPSLDHLTTSNPSGLTHTDPALAGAADTPVQTNAANLAGEDVNIAPLSQPQGVEQEREPLSVDTGVYQAERRPLDQEQQTPTTALYEHQSDATTADEAVDEAPTSALLADSEASVPLDTSLKEPITSIGAADIGVDSAVPSDLSDFKLASTAEDDQIQNSTQPDVTEVPNVREPLSAEHESAQERIPDGGTQGDFPEVDDLDDDAAFFSGTPTGAAKAKDLGLESAGHVQHDSSVPEAPENDSSDDPWAAAFSDDELLESSSAASEGKAEGASTSIDPSGFFDDDDDGGFLLDNGISQPLQDRDTNDLGNQPSQHQPASTYGSSNSDFGPRPSATPTSFLPGIAGQFASLQDNAQRPTASRSASSFADRSKAGYASPYDLPTDIITTRKRPVVGHSTPLQNAMPAPPPRTSSVQSTASYNAGAATPLPAVGPPRPPSTVGASLHPPQQVAGSQQSLKKATTDASGFFADLPMNARPRPRGTPTPSFVQPQAPAPPPSLSARPPQAPRHSSYQPPPSSNSQSSQPMAGLQQPAPLPIYPEQDTAPVTPLNQPPPVTSDIAKRYSPAPVNQQPNQPPAALPKAQQGTLPPAPLNRYASVPSPASSTMPPRAHSFIPKTSSPLAYIEGAPTSLTRQSSLVSPTDMSDLIQANNHRHRLSDQYDSLNQLTSAPPRTMTPPQTAQSATSTHSSPRSSRYAPSTTADVGGSRMPQNNNVRSQSPLHPQLSPRKQDVSITDRQYSTQLPNVASSQPTSQQPLHSGLSLPSRGQLTSNLSFQVPQDERRDDPLERWKGQPIFRWAPSGVILSCFPTQAPFYAAGHAIPVTKCSAGPVVIHDTKATYPLSEIDTKFPGPLQGKGKGKKKEVLQWITTKIDDLGLSYSGSPADSSTPKLFRQRAEEKVMLWKIMKILLELDNSLEGKPDVGDAIRAILIPSGIEEQSPISDADRQRSVAETFNAQSLTKLRELLHDGQREKAVWYASEQNLWSHAMLIASTMGQDMWKQLIHEFVKSQVKSPGDSLRSMAALYEIFGGNFEECTDELVPPSTQARFPTQGSLNGIELEGLEKWRETLSLTINNRSPNDGQAIAALGKLLAKYGRVEASHVCFLLAKSASFNGVDNAEAQFVLLGSDRKADHTALGSDLDSILLTEVFEYTQSLAPAPGIASVIPHLQSYKLIHAFNLAEHGFRSEALAYCDFIFSSVKASTRASPYYHAAFINAVEDLSRCLSQAPPSNTSSGLLAKFSSDKVSTGLFRGFTKFVAGDDDETASNASGSMADPREAGPFGKVAPSPGVSRSASSADLYGAMTGANTGVPSYQVPYSPASPNLGFDNSQGGLPYGGQAAPNGAGGRYASQSSNALVGSRSVSNLRAYEPQRSTTGYSAPSATSRAPSRTYNPYAPQAQEGHQASFSGTNGVARPEPVTTTSDYSAAPLPLATAPADSLPYGLAQTASAPASQYNYRPSPLSETSSPPSHHGYMPSPVQQPTAMPGSASLAPSLHSESPRMSFDTPRSYGPPQPDHDSPAPNYATPHASFEPPKASYSPPTASFDDNVTHAFGQPEQSSYEQPATTSYEAPSYEPPSYQPYEPDFGPSNDADDEPKPKKKGVMDLSDEEPYAPRPSPAQNDAARKAAERAEADRAADAAFRAAAEADAAKDKAAKDAAKKAGWFGGWFAGKKEGLDGAGGPNVGASGGSAEQPQKAIRAKLGEENSFYFDKELGKWVNKKAGAGGDGATRSAPTPPPPRAGPPGGGRPPLAAVGAGSAGPPTPLMMGGSGPPSRAASGMGPAVLGPPGQVAANGTPPPPGPAAAAAGELQPPSRPATSMSNASSIDDLLGPVAAGGKRGTVKGKKKGGRYVDVMAK